MIIWKKKGVRINQVLKKSCTYISLTTDEIIKISFFIFNKIEKKIDYMI